MRVTPIGDAARLLRLAQAKRLDGHRTSSSVVELDEEEVRRRVDPAECPVQLERRGRRRPLGALRDDDLEGVARADVLLRALDRRRVAVGAEVRFERRGLPRPYF